ncbi:phospholipase/carboxylesterase [Georgenia soli]|uniref:Phospholipase/carboxylesterase n=1 Tax=Georgenia soli TaxID=638953 RepID=A0A2A9EL11_9MICO|nr:alpha/beta fold hydrolase [Georgenia soli]PFG39644.1 phospholipase/carboxylesterase [Georgenia soli]
MTLSIDRDTVRWSAPAGSRAGRPLLVLLHGYGSNENDLFGLAPHLPADAVVASLRAPGTNRVGYEWFPLDGELAGPLGHRQTPTTDRLREDGTNTAALAVLDWLDSLDEAPSAVGLLGFSQGGAVAVQAMRQRPEAVDHVVLLSGFVAPGDLPGDAVLAERRPPVLYSRGAADPVIASFLVDRTDAWLPRHSELTASVHPGLGHGVSADTVAEVHAFLQAQYA